MNIPEKYKCTQCDVSNVKLWRRYLTMEDEVSLFCLICAEKDQNKKFNIECSPDIGWLVPAIPIRDECDLFHGRLSIPQERVDWWHSIPE